MSFHTLPRVTYEYDKEKDGVWIVGREDGDRWVFVHRNTIIEMLGMLPLDPPERSKDD